MMVKLIYRFLDDYLGDEIVCVKTQSSIRYDTYDIFSRKNNFFILTFRVHTMMGDVVIFRNTKLTDMVSSLFNLDWDDSASIIRDWFAEKHNLSRGNDLKKFIN